MEMNKDAFKEVWADYKAELTANFDRIEKEMDIKSIKERINKIETNTSDTARYTGWISCLLTLTFIVITNILFWPWFINLIKS